MALLIWWISLAIVFVFAALNFFGSTKTICWTLSINPSPNVTLLLHNIDFDDLLIAVGGSSNSKKSSFDPASWMPSNIDYSCEYLRKWLNIKAEFRLSVDEDEKIAIESLYETNNCSI